MTLQGSFPGLFPGFPATHPVETPIPAGDVDHTD